MVLWRDNIDPEYNVERYIDLIHSPQCRRKDEEGREHYTSYFDNVDENSYAVVQSNLEGIMSQFDFMPYSIQLAAMKLQVQPFYESVCADILKELKILNENRVNVTLWSQGYLGNDSDGHGEHHHYHSECRTILSWVHFVEPVEDDCFEFITGNETITPSQRKNDFIVFPSWARHHVKPHHNERRLVVAGNITLRDDDNLKS